MKSLVFSILAVGPLAALCAQEFDTANRRSVLAERVGGRPAATVAGMHPGGPVTIAGLVAAAWGAPAKKR